MKWDAISVHCAKSISVQFGRQIQYGTYATHGGKPVMRTAVLSNIKVLQIVKKGTQLSII
jgi:hypothetical protein